MNIEQELEQAIQQAAMHGDNDYAMLLANDLKNYRKYYK